MSDVDRDALPSFDKPPVIEVVCGMLFNSLDTLLIPHFGALWERFKSDYPKCQEAAPLLPVVERFDEMLSERLDLVDGIPLPRVWFVHKDGNGVIQVQRDRFLHNWRKAGSNEQYPRYPIVKKLFSEHLLTFRKFLDEYTLGELFPRQYEITYINHIPRGEGWESIEDVGKVFPDVAWRVKKGRFLSVPDGIDVKTSFLLPDKSGRLHVAIRNAIRRADSVPILLMELTARGMPRDPSPEAMWRWFDIGREWIVRGFADLTGNEIQEKVWRRTS